MFRLQKSKPAKSGERIDFKFSNFKALQVPKGWDKLIVSIVSVETGKTIVKSSKAAVRNGSCQWADTLSDSVWVPQDESSEELDQDCLFKFVVAMGSARSGILGEATVSVASYMGSGASIPLSFPLKKCNHGTTLQVKIQCLTPRIRLRDNESKDTNSHEKGITENTHDKEMNSKESDTTTIAKSVESYTRKGLGSITNQEGHGKREAYFYNAGSHQSYDSVDGSIVRESFSPLSNLSGDEHDLTERQDPTGFQSSASQSNQSSLKSRITYSENLSQDDLQELAPSPLRVSGSSKRLLEAAEDTIEDLRGEAKLWERNATKLMLDLELLRKECSEQSRTNGKLDIELSAACAERDGLQKEVEQLKLLLEKSKMKPALEDSIFLGDGLASCIKELETDNKFQKESNANLTLQLNRSQESNAELVSVLQELEETVQKQRLEMDNLCALRSKFSDMEYSIQVNSEENRNLRLQMQQLQESEKNLQAEVQVLAQALEEKNQNMENVSMNNQTLLDTETEYKRKLASKEREIVSLKEKLFQSLKERHFSAEMQSMHGDDGFLTGEVEALKGKLQELERDCQELTDENLELLLKLKETRNNAMERCASFTSSRSEEREHETQMHRLEEKMKNKLKKEIEIDYKISIEELQNVKLEQEIEVTELRKELSENRAEIERLEACLLSKEDELGNFKICQRELEAKLSVLGKEKDQLEENMKIVAGESDIATKCLNDLSKDLAVLSSSVDSHVSANKILERKSSELESGKHELELHLLKLKQENDELSARISPLEAQLKSLKDEKESSELALENSKSDVVNLQDEISRLKNVAEANMTDVKQKLKQLRNQWSEAQEECEYTRKENSKLQAIVENLVEECDSLQKSNGELNRHKLELHDQCVCLEAKLRQSHTNFTDCSKRVMVLEENIYSMMQDTASKEKILASELDVLIEENHMQNKRFSLLNQAYSERMVEVENLQYEVQNLTKKLYERERIASEAVHEVSDLRSVISKLNSEHNAAQMESEAKVQRLMDELAASKQNEEMLKADNGRISKLLVNYKSCEEDFKTTLNALELKLTVSEYERQQVMEECTNLKAQLLKLGSLKDEVLALKDELNATKSEREKLEDSLRLMSGECKGLKIEKNSFIERIINLQKAVSELEDCKQQKIALEEKVLRMEGDLMAKETLCEQYAEINSELGRIKRCNKQFLRQVQQLEEEKKACIRRAQSLEEQFALMKEEQDQREASNMNPRSSQNLTQGDKGDKITDEGDRDGIDPASKIRSLEDELAKAKEANNAYKIQLKRLKPEGRKSYTGSPRKPSVEGEVVPKERFERTKSSLESELKDIRERYLHMSLKYAEVEAQREELVMKLKAVNNGKRWHK